MKSFRELCQEAADRRGLKGDPVELWREGFNASLPFSPAELAGYRSRRWLWTTRE